MINSSIDLDLVHVVEQDLDHDHVPVLDHIVVTVVEVRPMHRTTQAQTCRFGIHSRLTNFFGVSV